MLATASCPVCERRVPGELVNLGDLLPCPGCETAIQVHLFPALLRPLEAGRKGRDLAHASESACFFHPEKQAVVPCDGCGRFLCSLCDVEVAGQHLCPTCVDSGRKHGRLSAMENKRTLYDRMALMLAVWPLLLWPLTLVTAPYALYVCFRHYRSPVSFVVPGRWRFWVAGTLAAAQVVGWIVVFIYLIGENL